MASSQGQQSPRSPNNAAPRRTFGERWGWLDVTLFRVTFVLLAVAATYHFRPFLLSGFYSGLLGVFLGLVGVLLEMRLRHSTLKRLLGALVGAIAGILCAYLISVVLSAATIELHTQSYLQVAFLLVLTYLGIVIGANKGDLLNLQALGGLFGAERSAKRHYKVLDTSVIIDGRIADVGEAGFLDGVLLLPQFMLRELQLVADSGDALKRNRGRRGLDMLQRIQKIAKVHTQIVEDDYPHIPDVDRKLIELAKHYEAKIVTNDFNLNKVAQLQGVDVLNINELANALRPIVLPGEAMRVFILKEGKEYNQGVAYLDDGTMVVVENARRQIGRTLDITVTSVLQTTAGKMIFGRYDEGRGTDRPGSGGHPAGGRPGSGGYPSGGRNAGNPGSGRYRRQRPPANAEPQSPPPETSDSNE